MLVSKSQSEASITSEVSLPDTFLRLRSRLPDATGAGRLDPEAKVLGGKLNDLGVLSGVFGKEPPPVNQSEIRIEVT